MARRELNVPPPELQRLLLNLMRLRSKEEEMCSHKKMRRQKGQEEYEL